MRFYGMLLLLMTLSDL